jgi:hypothetical protein
MRSTIKKEMMLSFWDSILSDHLSKRAFHLGIVRRAGPSAADKR